LLPLTREHPKNFIVLSQSATANFLSNNPDFRPNAGQQMKEALALWPKNWDELDDQQKKFLQRYRIVGETEIERYRKYETYLERLITNRLREERRAKKGERVEENIDPIFVDKEGKPLRFVNDKGEFVVGWFPIEQKDALPRDAVEIVETLLIWMPN